MNNLNSCIVQGNVISFTKKSDCIDVLLKMSRYEKNDNGEMVESFAEVPCRFTGNFIPYFERFGKIGDGLRVVGRLAGVENLVVFAEHTEFLSSRKKKEV